MSRVELFEKIRRDHEFDGLSTHALARRYGVHRRTVRQALGSAVPPERKRPVGRPAPALGAFREWIDEILVADQTAPRKQRHTAKRIGDRLADEHGVVVAGSTMRDHVRQRRRELGLAAEAFCEQVHDPGVTAEVDWGEATVSVAGVVSVLGLFLMRSCFSGACFVMAFESQSQQAFFEGHVHALDWYGGVFTTIRYDNLAAAAKKSLKGRNRVENERFVALRSHYLYESWFTLVGIQGAHEKGGVEGEVGRFRRNHLVPVPEVADLAQLNDRLLACCIRDLGRTITGRSETVGGRLSEEIDLLRPLPASPFPTWEQSTHRVNQKSMITVRRNHYSVPVCLAGTKVAARVGAREIEVLADGQLVASHPRLRGSQLRSAGLDHYLELLRDKPGALQHSFALRQEREQGRWPDCFDELWTLLKERVGASEAARQIVDVLLLCRDHDPKVVELAVRGALAAGAIDGRAVALLIDRKARPPAEAIELPDRLAQHERPAPTLGEYDQLLDTDWADINSASEAVRR
ncbi:MAG TPA: IS21 family transposase [Polyangia bacterium]|nr:IS21 family transposase [Polyangia bacterium]